MTFRFLFAAALIALPAAAHAADERLPEPRAAARAEGIPAQLDEAQRGKLLEIANKCPVHRTLHSEVWIPTTLAA